MSAAAADDIPRTIRPATADDGPFVWETTLKVHQPRSRMADGTSRPAVCWADWVNLRGAETMQMLRDSRVLVMESGNILLGFVVVSQGVVRMLYVKRDFRGNGFGLELLSADGPAIDHARADARFPHLEPRPLYAARPTPSWKRWARLHGIQWVTA